MDRQHVAVLVAVCMALALVPAGVAAAEEPAEAVATATGPTVDATVTDRYRAGASAGLSRVDTDGVLEQPTRASIYEAIDESPGIDLAGLAAAADVTKSTARYHVDVLRDAGLVAGVEVAGALRFAPAELDAEVAGVLGTDAPGTVLTAVADHEPASVRTLAEATDRAPSTVSHHLSELEARGLVERERRGEAVLTSLAPPARDALETAPATADD